MRTIVRHERILLLLGLILLSRIPVFAQTARVQFINACTFEEADTIDVYINGELALDDLAHSRGTAYREYPAGTLHIETARGGARSSADPFHSQTLTLVSGEMYVAIAAGDPLLREGEPPFRFFVRGGMREFTSIPGFVEMMSFNNLPHSELAATARGVTDQSIQARYYRYGEFSEYHLGAPMQWDIDLLLHNPDSVRSTVQDLRQWGRRTSLNTGFGDFVVLSDGTTLFGRENVAWVQFINNTLYPLADTVDVFVDGRKVVDALPFGSATSFIDLPSGLHDGTAPDVVVELKRAGAGNDEDPLVTLEQKYLFDHRYVAVLADDPGTTEEESQLGLHVAEVRARDDSVNEFRATFFHGAPGVSSVVLGLGGDPYVPATSQLVFGSFESAIALPVADTTLFVLDAANRKLLASFHADLASWNLEDSTVVLLTSPLDIGDGESTAAQGQVALLAALPSGGPLVSLEPIVPTPWWRQPWMLVLLLLGLAVLALIVFQLRILRLRARERELSALVDERTRELVAAKEKTEEQARRLAELDEAKNRFFANISHEFRTPLTLILGPLQDALDGRYRARPELFDKQIGVMHRSARRLLRLINQLLDLSRLESGEMKLQKEAADLAEFTRQLALGFVPLSERRGIQMQVPSDLEPLPLEFDPDAMEKALSNLISNALKFTPEGGKVHVNLKTEPADNPAYVDISVKDTGPGISSEDLERIFDRFQQADTSIRRPFEGSGIGLALAKELTELHGGQLLVDSTPGFGTTFTVRLPLPETLLALAVGEDDGRSVAGVELEEAALETGGTPAPSDATDGDRPVILIVEDNPDVRAYVRDHLEEEYHILEAEDGEEGLATAQDHNPALVLADVMMPNMDGYEMCRLIKANEALRHIPVVMLTAKAAERDTLEGLHSGADDYLAKPFSVKELKARVANLISTRRDMRETFSREIIVRPGEITITPEEEIFLDQVLEAVNAHIGDSNLTVDWLADEVGLSRRQLERRVETVTGQSPASLIRHLRLERASQLLRAGAGTVAEIAYAVGFKSPAHFSRAFKDVYGETPSVHMQVIE